MGDSRLAPPPVTSAPAPARPGPPPPTSEQHPLALSVLLHLLPGAALTAFVVVAAPILTSRGLDPLLALLLGIGLVIAPLELGYLSLYARRTTGSWSPLAAVDYRTRLPAGRLALLGAGLAAWFAIFLLASQAFLDGLLSRTVFAWVPDAILEFSVVSGGDGTAGAGLVVLVVAFFVLNGVLGPVTEELYFRGHLLPRIDRYGRWAPVLNTALFALYHFHTPWRYPAILLGFLPTTWVAWRRRSMWVAMAAHVIVNMLMLLLLLAAFLAAGT